MKSSNVKIGDKTNVKIEFEDDEFDGNHVASIHNHTKDMYTPPSDKNFGIFSREWEDYELIAASNCKWVLKGKYMNENFVKELRKESSKLFFSSLTCYLRRYSPLNMAYDNVMNYMGKDYQII